MMIGVMRSFWKVFAALALMLPLGAFVAGTLVPSAADEPAPRDTIIIDQQSRRALGNAVRDTILARRPPDPTPAPRRPRGQASSQGSDDHGGDDGLEQVSPSPDDWDDDSSGHAATATTAAATATETRLGLQRPRVRRR